MFLRLKNVWNNCFISSVDYFEGDNININELNTPVSYTHLSMEMCI